MEDFNSCKIRCKKRPFSSHSATRNHLRSQVIKPTEAYDISNLPDADSILLEILSRLPLKSVFMFKCVSKHWLTLISHSSFKTFYFSRMQTLSLPFRILFSYIQDLGIEGVLDRILPESYDSLDSGLFLHMKRQKDSPFIKVIGVSNGLMLCRFSCSGHWAYYVSDPVSRQRVDIPIPERYTAYIKKNLHNFQGTLGEGFVTQVDDENNVITSFTVVLVSSKMKTSKGHLILDIFSSKTGKWSEYRLPCPIYIKLRRFTVGPIVFNGILHWFVKDHGMVAFDPYKDPKSCRIIGFPVDRDVKNESTLYLLCDGCQGRLQFFQVARDVSSFYCFSMWVMKDYKKGEWRSEFKVTRSDLSSSNPRLNSLLMRAKFLPLCFDPLNLDIVYMSCFELGCVVSYSIHNRKLEVASKPSGVAGCLIWRVVVPFVIPRWPTRVPVPPVQDRELNDSMDME